MRVGKKPAVAVESKKTRSGMMRLEKVRSSPGETAEEKQFKGPLKKRPIAQISSPAAPKAKEREKVKSTQKYVDKSADVYETPPTIAAGRSRRAIKPNPKYASEDMVTPRIIKNVSVLTGGSNKKPAVIEKERKISESSEDFFNKDSSDDFDDVLLQQMGKASDEDDKHLDYDSSDMHIAPTAKPRGRPRKNIYNQTTYSESPDIAPRSVASPKLASQVQLQHLRKSLGSSSISRSPTITLGLKRKYENERNTNIITNKRFLYAPRLTKQNLPEKDHKVEENQHTGVRKSITGQMPNGSKIIISQDTDDDELVATVSNSSGAASSNLKTASTAQRKSPNTRLLSSLRQRSSSPAVNKLRETVSTTARSTRASPLSSAADDVEAMPTFTIVNINDIINKKGDVLISKSGDKNATSSPVTDKNNRRRIGNTATTSAEKPEPLRKQTILNHTLLNKSAGNLGNQRVKISAVSAAKPAPRILNSMVAKKLQPVKPKIANPDDSADESYSLSLDDEEPDEQETDRTKTFIGARKTSIFSSQKTPAPVVKTENSTTPNNRLPVKPPVKGPHRKTPETVVISREGDKIVKKVTCFETWYVINMSSKRPVTIDRNILDMPLIELANRVEEIKLPSDRWSNKVTLYELSPAILTKSGPISVYTGDLTEQNIAEEDRYKYQVSCVMFRRAVNTQFKSRLPYDRAVIFKNKTFFMNIEGKNVRLVAAPTTINSNEEIETLLDIVDTLTLQSNLVEPTTTVQ